MTTLPRYSWAPRYSGTVTGILCGLALGGVLSLGAFSSGSPQEVGRFFGATVPFAAAGLLLDLLLARYPDRWRSSRPGQLWGSQAVRMVFYWVAAYPVAMLIYFLMLGVASRYISDAASFLGFLAYQAFWGSAFGVGFLMLYGRVVRMLRA